MQEIHRFTDGAYEVAIYQCDNGKFKIGYGLQSMKELDYDEAAHRYGEYVFHSLAAEGLMNNE